MQNVCKTVAEIAFYLKISACFLKNIYASRFYIYSFTHSILQSAKVSNVCDVQLPQLL